MKAINLTLFLFILFIEMVNGQSQQTVDYVDISRYLGRWYDIASYPASFQKGCRCTTADYEEVPGREFIRVINRCIKFRNKKSKLSVAKGKAYIVKGSGNAKLKVQFLWPFKGDYYIIGLADDYSWALVGHPQRKYLWILSRESYMPADVYNHIVELARQKGYDIRKIKKTPQNCDNP